MTSITKLILSFTVVILFMVGGITAYVFYWQGEQGRDAAAHKVDSALSKLNSDFTRMQVTNREFAGRLARDSNLVTALAKSDRAAIAALLKNVGNERHFAGFIAVFSGTGTVVYSSDAPLKFGYSMRGKNPSVDYVLNSLDNFSGLTIGLTDAQSIAVTVMVPIIGEGGKCQGIVAVCQPLNEEFLTGEAMKLALFPEPLADIDFVLLGGKNNNYFSLTPGLLKDKPAFVQQLSEHGPSIIPGWQDRSAGQGNDIFKWFGNLFHSGAGTNAAFVKDGRFWQQYNLGSVGIILGTTLIHAEGIKPGFIIIITCVLGLLAFVLALVFSAKISNFETPAQALITHLKDWQADKPPPPAIGFSGIWQELAEVIDRTLGGKQHYIEALKLQLNKTTQQVNEISKEGQTADGQFAALDRQVANQNKQLSEFSRQLNYANQQNVFLQQELQAILQSTTEGFLVLDGYGNVLSANNIFLNWLGMSEAEIAGRFCFDLVRKPGEGKNYAATTGNEPARAFVKHEANTAALIDEFFPEGVVHHAKSGQAVEVLLHLQPIAGQDNNIQGYILVVRDKSLRSEIVKLRMEMTNMLTRAIRAPLISAEKEWHNLLANPEFKPSPALHVNDKLGEKNTAQLDTMDSAASPLGIISLAAAAPALHKSESEDFFQSAQKEKKEFSGQSSHKSDKEFEPAVRHILNDLHSRYQNLIRSVESLLSVHGQSSEQLATVLQTDLQLVEGLDNIFPRAEALHLESFPITRLVGDCLEEVAGIARGRHLVLDHKTSTALPNIKGNRAVIKSILGPIVDKIITSTDAGGKVRVESTIEDKEIKLRISSSGPALSEEEIVDMFAGFIPEKHNEDSYGGRLSLYLARNNAERIGAHVWAQSESGRGTAIYITLPVG